MKRRFWFPSVETEIEDWAFPLFYREAAGVNSFSSSSPGKGDLRPPLHLGLLAGWSTGRLTSPIDSLSAVQKLPSRTCMRASPEGGPLALSGLLHLLTRCWIVLTFVHSCESIALFRWAYVPFPFSNSKIWLNSMEWTGESHRSDCWIGELQRSFVFLFFGLSTLAKLIWWDN